jgi:CysZ protein
MVRGFKLLTDPGLKRFVLIPIVVNLVIFIILSYFFVQSLGGFNEWVLTLLPDWLDFLASILWVLTLLLFILIYGYSFALLTNLIAAPFYGMLAEKVQIKLTGKVLASESLQQMIPRTLEREIVKLCYFIGYGVVIFFGLVLFSFIPLINIAVPVLGILWVSWVMVVQYVDYPADNNKVSFKQLRQTLGAQRWASFSLGGLILLGSMIPIVNIFIAPAAVAASTIYWVETLNNVNDVKVQQT